MIRPYIISGLIVHAATVLAAEGKPAELDTLVVTARPARAQSLEHITQPAAVLAGDALHKKQQNSIGETLASELGVTASSFGQGASRPIIRGLSGARVLVLQDGIGTLDVSSISDDHAVTIEPLQATQIEILRGPATLLYGSGASGGLVNVVTGRIPAYVPDEFNANLATRYDSAKGERVLALRAKGGLDNFALHFDGLKRATDDYEAADGEIPNSAVKTEDHNLGASFFGERGHFGFAFGRYGTRYEIPPEEDHPENVFIDLRQDRLDFAGQLDDPLPGFHGLRLRAGHNEYTHTEFEAPDEPHALFNNNEWEGRLELDHLPIAGFNGTLGAQYRNRSFSVIGEEAFLPAVKLESVGVFLFEDRDWRDWHFEFSARFEHQDTEPTFASGRPSVTHDVYGISGGALWKFTQGYTLGFNAARAQRAPVIEELFADGPHHASLTFEEGNPALDEETANNFDLSLRKTDGRLTWSANFFVNIIEDFIFMQALDENGDGIADRVDEDRNLVPDGELLLVEYRQDDALFYGAELESILRIFEDRRGQLDLRLFGDWVRGYLTNSEDLPRIPPARLGGGLSYMRGPWQGDLDLVQVFRQKDVAPLETETGGYVLLDAGLSYTLAAKPVEATLFLRGANLLDEDARRHVSLLKDRAPLPGRSAILGVEMTF